MLFTYTDAILKLRPEACFTIYNNNYDTLIWLDSIQSQPTEEEIIQQISAMQSDWASKEYQRLRQPHYPSLNDLADAVYWQSKGDNSKMEEYLNKVELVKELFPK